MKNENFVGMCFCLALNALTGHHNINRYGVLCFHPALNALIGHHNINGSRVALVFS